jgi:hypothetical protein
MRCDYILERDKDLGIFTLEVLKEKGIGCRYPHLFRAQSPFLTMSGILEGDVGFFSLKKRKDEKDGIHEARIMLIEHQVKHATRQGGLQEVANIQRIQDTFQMMQQGMMVPIVKSGTVAKEAGIQKFIKAFEARFKKFVIFGAHPHSTGRVQSHGGVDISIGTQGITRRMKVQEISQDVVSIMGKRTRT